MKQLILLSLLTFVFVITACKTNKKNTSTAEAPTTLSKEEIISANNLISMSKGACYGTCPIYTMTIHENGIAKFAGKRFCTMIGPHIAQLSGEQIESLKHHTSKIKFETFSEKIESMVADLPSTEITFYRADGSSKSIWWKTRPHTNYLKFQISS